MKIKNILLSVVAFGGLMINPFIETVDAKQSKREVEELQYQVTEKCDYENANYCGNNSLTNGLDSNQTTLFYMYSNNKGHYFLDPLAEYENVIFVGLNDWKVDSNFKIDTSSLHHGDRFIGTFTDNTLWELTGIEKVVFE